MVSDRRGDACFGFPISQLTSAYFFIIIDTKSEEMPAPEVGSGEPIPLPDIKQVLQMKALEESARAEVEENQGKQVKINRRDKDAFARVRSLASTCYRVLYFLLWNSSNSVVGSFLNNNLMLMPTIPFLKKRNTTLSVLF